MERLPTILTTGEGIISLVVLLIIEIGLVIGVGVTVQVIVGMILSRIGTVSGRDEIRDRMLAIRRSLRRIIVLTVVSVTLMILGYNGCLVWFDLDPSTHTQQLIRSVPTETWVALAIGAGKTVGAVILAIIGKRIISKTLKRIQERINAWDQVKENDESLAAFFAGLERALLNTLWLMVLVYAFRQLQAPESITAVLLRVITIYLTIAVGLLVVRMTTAVVATLDAFSAQVAADKSWFRYYDHLRPLVPLLRRCLEFALWIGIATLVLLQVQPISAFAQHGPNLIQAIGIFFLGRVGIELGHLFIDHSAAPHDGMDELDRRRRETMVPLFKSIFSYAAFFLIAVLMMSAVGFEVMPLLAGAGILGVVLGLGAQPLINDIMSGFFILFEHVFLVGDFVEVNGARGTIEAIDFRTTRLRDVDGRLHVIRNGEMRQVINSSKEFTYAVVELELPYDANVERALAILAEEGRLLAETDERALAPSEVRGITEFDDWGMKVRCVIKVVPACHSAVAAAYRLRILTAFREAGISMAVPLRKVEMNGAAPNPAS